MPKPVGLANLGNTCYLNSTLQVLAQIPELRNLKHNVANTVPSTCLIDEWLELSHIIDSTGTSGTFVSPTRFVQAVRGVAAHEGKLQFTGFAQNDATEFLYFLLNGWHDAAKRPVKMHISGTGDTEKDKLAKLCYDTLKQTYEKEYSEMMQLFFGITTNKIIPMNSGENTAQYSAELFSILHVPISNARPTEEGWSVMSCIREYAKGTQVDYNGGQAIKETSFWTLPKYMFIALGRFSGDGRRKNDREVSVPARLDLSEFISSYNPLKYSNYELMGVVLHMGSLHGGHYVSVVRTWDNQWYSCNDTCVFLEEEFVEKKLSHPNMTRGAYILLYKNMA